MPKNQAKPKTVTRRRRVKVRRGIAGLDAKAMAYRQLLLDPCNGPLVPPTAIGPTTGLLFRQRKLIDLSATVVSNPAPLTYSNSQRWWYALYKPALGTVQIGVSTGVDATGTAGASTIDLETVGVLANARAYRAVAGCIRFVPTGPIGSRSGAVAAAYVPDNVASLPDGLNNGNTMKNVVSNYFAFAQHTVSNASGTEMPEAKWLPSDPADLEFRDKSVVYNADSGTVLLAGREIDSSDSTSAAISTITARGYIEVTTVYEWVPAYDQGIGTSVEVASTTSLQTVLASMGNLALAATSSEYAKSLAKDAAKYVIGRGMRQFMGAAANVMMSSRPGPALLTSGGY